VSEIDKTEFSAEITMMGPYRIDRGIRNTSRQISFEFLFIKTRPLANYIPDSDVELNDETKSVM